MHEHVAIFVEPLACAELCADDGVEELRAYLVETISLLLQDGAFAAAIREQEIHGPYVPPPVSGGGGHVGLKELVAAFKVELDG